MWTIILLIQIPFAVSLVPVPATDITFEAVCRKRGEMIAQNMRNELEAKHISHTVQALCLQVRE